MLNPQHNIIGSRIYCSGGWSKSLEIDLKKACVKEIELLNDWGDVSCFEGFVDNVEYLQISGSTATDSISSLENLSVFKNLKNLVIGSKVKKKYDLSELVNLESIDAVWQLSIATILNSEKLKHVILSSVDEKIMDFSIDNSNVEFLWIARPKLNSLNILKCFPGLERLRVSDSRVLETIEGIESCVKLAELDIENARKLNSIHQVEPLSLLSNIRLMKVSPNFDMSNFIDHKHPIRKLCLAGSNVPELPWLELIKNKCIRKLIGWWNPEYHPKQSLVNNIASDRKLMNFDDNGKKTKQVLVVEFE